MSNRVSGLGKAIRAAGSVVSYTVAYMRIARMGWDVERAVSTPVHVRKDKIFLTEVRALPGDRIGYTDTDTEPRKRKQYIPSRNDSAPLRIQALRKAYCDEFIRTGNLNEALGAKLKDYANECRTTAKRAQRIPDEHADQRHGREDNRYRDDGSGDALQTPAGERESRDRLFWTV